MEVWQQMQSSITNRTRAFPERGSQGEAKRLALSKTLGETIDDRRANLDLLRRIEWLPNQRLSKYIIVQLSGHEMPSQSKSTSKVDCTKAFR